jgi:conjugative transfer region protein (TIGR03748 family)
MNPMVLLSAVLIVSGAASAETIRVSRYLTASDTPSSQQQFPLQAASVTAMPAEIESVRQAIDYVMKPTGYAPLMSLQVARLFDLLPLPYIHRSSAPLSSENTLKVLAGSGFTLEIDNLYRTIGFIPATEIDEADLVAVENTWTGYKARTLTYASKNEALEPAQSDTYQVKDGDSVSAIGFARGITRKKLKAYVQEVVALNPHAFVNRDPNRLEAGVKIQLPRKGHSL